MSTHLCVLIRTIEVLEGGKSMKIFLDTLQQVITTFDDGASSFSTDYSNDEFTIKVIRDDGRGTPCIKYDGVKLSYMIEDCPEYDDPTRESLEDLYWAMRFIEED